jgi:hypothetical protein
MDLISEFFWDCMHSGIVGCTETSATRYCKLRNIPEESGSHLQPGGSLKSHVSYI